MTQRREMRERARWKKSYNKRLLRNRKGLSVGSYALGCRQHPGIIIYNNGWDVTIKSMLDGVEEDCSIYHCAPAPLSKEAAEQYASYYQKHGREMFELWFHEEGYDRWVDQWRKLKEGEYGFGKPLHEYLGFTENKYEIYLNRSWPDNHIKPLPFDD